MVEDVLSLGDAAVELDLEGEHVGRLNNIVVPIAKARFVVGTFSLLRLVNAPAEYPAPQWSFIYPNESTATFSTHLSTVGVRLWWVGSPSSTASPHSVSAPLPVNQPRAVSAAGPIGFSPAPSPFVFPTLPPLQSSVTAENAPSSGLSAFQILFITFLVDLQRISDMLCLQLPESPPSL